MGTKRSASLPALISLKDLTSVPQITYIRNSKFTIGRGNDSSLKILHKSISRRHCTIEKQGPQWTIVANSSNVIKLNGQPLSTNEPTLLRCNDKINLVGVTEFVFKCSPDQNQKCCSDFMEPKFVDLQLENDIQKPVTILSQFPASSSSNSPQTSESKLHNEPDDRKDVDSVDSETSTCRADTVSQSSSSDVESLDSFPKIDDLENALQKYIDSSEAAGQCSDSAAATNWKAIEALKLGIDFIKRSRDFNSYYSASTDIKINSPELLSQLKKLLSSIKDKLPILCRRDSSKHDEKLNRIISLFELLFLECTQVTLCNIHTLLEHSCNSALSSGESSANGSVDKNPHSSSESKVNDVKDEPEEDKLKSELKLYKQNAEWQEARIQYLEMKLKERDKLEVELETAKERNEALETCNTELKRTLARKEVAELELQLLKETYKYKEDDKRNKDALEQQISILKNDAKALKDENEKLTSNRYLLENEIDGWKKKCEELDTKLKEKSMNSGSGCSSNSTGEYCCDMVKEVKGSLMDLMEKEFNCCICGDIFIEATVTNCNHVFCSYCLKEWKKKKKQCPFCRANITKECRAPVMDEFITNLTKLISDKSYAERVQLLDERKSAGTPPAKRARRGMPTRVAVPNPPPMYQFPQQMPPQPMMFPYQHQNIDIVNLF